MEQEVTTDADLLTAAIARIPNHEGGDGPEGDIEALYQAATGAGYDLDCDGVHLASEILHVVVPAAGRRAWTGRRRPSIRGIVAGVGTPCPRRDTPVTGPGHVAPPLPPPSAPCPHPAS